MQRHQSLEPLEPRNHFADVTTEIRDGILYITGTSGADHIALVGGADFDAEIAGKGDTTMNGMTSDFGLAGKHPVFVELAGGNDVLEIADGSWWSGQVSVIGGNGDDQVLTTPAIYNWFSRLFYAGGDGNDSLRITNRTVHGRIDFEGGAGRDRAYLENLKIAGRLNVVDRTGPTNLTCVGVTVKKPVTFDTGNSIDRLALTSVRATSGMIIRTRGGGDQASFLKTPFSDTSMIKLGGDATDTLLIG